MAKIQKITPFLWFNGRAEEAMEYYVSIFNNSKILSVSKIASGPAKNRSIVSFELEKQVFMAIDGGPEFEFSPAISFLISCKNQKEIDYFSEKLSSVPEAEQCGWVQDKFGVSWQIVPTILSKMVQDPLKAKKVTDALLEMKKIDIKKLKKAYEK